MKLHVGVGLSLPLEAVTEKLAFLGRTGSGKTYCAQKLAELMHEAGAQFVALDPVGKWWSLRLAADGKAPGISLPVFGGLQGDVPLEPAAGKLIADVIVDRGISAAVDVSQFESDADKARFMTDFGARFFFRKKAEPSAVHLFLEEAQEFIPQNPQRDEARMLHVWTRMQKLGRNFGIGTSILSQRPQEVNKKCLNQTELLFVFQLTGPQERAAIANWIEEKGIDEDIAAELPKLKQGAPHVWSPAWLQVSRIVSFSPKWTFDASSTPKVGAKKVHVKELSPIDLKDLKEKMAATIEKAKQEDPKELRRCIAELQKQLKVRPAETKVETKTERVEVPVLKDGQLTRTEKIIERAEAINQKVAAEVAELKRLVSPIQGNQHGHESRSHSGAAPQLRDARTKRAHRSTMVDHEDALSPITHERRQIVSEQVGRLPIGERKILAACIQYPNGLQRTQLTVITGYKRSSRDAYILRLSNRGLVDSQGDLIVATEAGIAALPDCEPLPTGESLRDYWLARLPVGERAILEILIEAHPQYVPRSDLDEATGYQRSSRDAYLNRLAAKELIEAGRGEVKASDQLFQT